LTEKLDTVLNRLGQLEKKVNDLAIESGNMKTNMTSLQNQANGLKQDVLTTIKNNGLKIGNRWMILEEGSNSYQALVFRDMNCGKDCRYAFFAGKYRDP
jgi:hypothetical protein